MCFLIYLHLGQTHQLLQLSVITADYRSAYLRFTIFPKFINIVLLELRRIAFLKLEHQLLSSLGDNLRRVTLNAIDDCPQKVRHLLLLGVHDRGLERQKCRNDQHGVLSRARVLVLEPSLNDVPQDELQLFR